MRALYKLLQRSKPTDPGQALFDAPWYLETNPDVSAAGVNPLEHFRNWGIGEGRKPNPLFDPSWYLTTYADVNAAKIDPLTHYAVYGNAERRDPSPYFNTGWYLDTYPDVSAAGINCLTHYLNFGRLEGRNIKRSDRLLQPKAAFLIEAARFGKTTVSYWIDYFVRFKLHIDIFIIDSEAGNKCNLFDLDQHPPFKKQNYQFVFLYGVVPTQFSGLNKIGETTVSLVDSKSIPVQNEALFYNVHWIASSPEIAKRLTTNNPNIADHVYCWPVVRNSVYGQIFSTKIRFEVMVCYDQSNEMQSRMLMRKFIPGTSETNIRLLELVESLSQNSTEDIFRECMKPHNYSILLSSELDPHQVSSMIEASRVDYEVKEAVGALANKYNLVSRGIDSASDTNIEIYNSTKFVLYVPSAECTPSEIKDMMEIMQSNALLIIPYVRRASLFYIFGQDLPVPLFQGKRELEEIIQHYTRHENERISLVGRCKASIGLYFSAQESTFRQQEVFGKVIFEAGVGKISNLGKFCNSA